MNLEQAIASARDWIQSDPDPSTRQQLQALIDSKNEAQLVDCMLGSLQFGTAGLRAVVGPGPMRMNHAVIRRTTEGVARYLKRQKGSEGRPVIVGGDARLSSPQFVQITVGVLAAHGIPVEYFDTPVSTPVAAYVARERSAIAAIVVTASHNPAPYNGYKLYGANAVQIVPPVDSEVAAEIAACPPATQIAMLEDAMTGGHAQVSLVPPQLVEKYYQQVGQLRPVAAPHRDLSIVYTAMHGVGHEPVSRVLADAGFVNFHSVAEQERPDGNFPTAPFPNPEEPGALDLATSLAQRIHADLIIANDPDVDRLAAALPTETGQWVALTGNQIGVLLADFALSTSRTERQPLVAQSIVSSPMLQSIAEAYGARFAQTLTGFKWIWTAALDLMADHSTEYVFGYEEALGFCAGHLVRDKDGISAALLLCELAAQQKAEGSTLRNKLEQLYRQHGLWVSAQHSVTKEGHAGAEAIRRAMQTVSDSPPTEILGHAVTQVLDYRSGEETRPRWLHNTSLVELQLGEAGRVLVRPSGTEPKIKCYVDLRTTLDQNSDVWQTESRLLANARQLAKALMTDIGL